MAPQYAPSLRSRLAPLLLFLQIGFITIYVFYVEIDAQTDLTRDFYASKDGGVWWWWWWGGVGKLFVCAFGRRRKKEIGFNEGIYVLLNLKCSPRGGGGRGCCWELISSNSQLTLQPSEDQCFPPKHHVFFILFQSSRTYR